MQNTRKVNVELVEKCERKVIIKRGKNAENYWEYCEEVGCDVWGILKNLPSASGEPICLWLNDKYKASGTSRYVQGVEVSADFCGEIPQGFEIITLPNAKYLRFQGEPFEEKDFGKAIEEVENEIKNFNPSTLGYCWDEENPRIQLEPIAVRGYIELLAVK